MLAGAACAATGVAPRDLRRSKDVTQEPEGDDAQADDGELLSVGAGHGSFFVVSARARGLLLRAKHLFVAAIAGLGRPVAPPATATDGATRTNIVRVISSEWLRLADKGIGIYHRIRLSRITMRSISPPSSTRARRSAIARRTIAVRYGRSLLMV